MQPFKKFVIREMYEVFKNEIENELDGYSNNLIASNSFEEICKKLYGKHLLQAVVIDSKPNIEDLINVKIQLSDRRNRNDLFDNKPVEGVRLVHTYGFKGSHILFSCNADIISLGGYPEIELYPNNQFRISVEETLARLKDDKNQLLKLRIDKDIAEIRKFIGYCNNAVEKFNKELISFTQKKVSDRTERNNLIDQLKKEYEIPLIPREPKQLEVISLEKIQISLKEEKGNETEYSISDKSYDSILGVIKHHCSTFERLPRVFLKFKEEELRDIILAALNCIFLGGATGETFRVNGHSDICIEFENRAAFIAECKFWKGEKSVAEAIDQLLSYTTWRDIKLCLIFFSKRKDFFEVTEKMHQVLNGYSANVSYTRIDKNLYSNIIKSKVNKNQNIILNTILVNLQDYGEDNK
jgi:hypothetical protein